METRRVMIVEGSDQSLQTLKAAAEQLGADCVLHKSTAHMCEAASDGVCTRHAHTAGAPHHTMGALTSTPHHTMGALTSEISRIFILFGIPANIKGYGFLREAVALSVQNPSMIHNVSRVLYPAVAAAFHTSASIVEASIRHAIEVAWNRGGDCHLNALFNVSVFRPCEKPTNSELIALIADKIRIDRAV